MSSHARWKEINIYVDITLLCLCHSLSFISLCVVVCIRFFLLWAHTKRKPNTSSTHGHTTNAYGRIGFSFISQPLFWAKKQKWCSKYTNKITWHFSFACLFNYTFRLNGCQIHFNPFGIQASGPKKDVSIECELMMMLLLLLLLYITSLWVDNRSWFETGIAPAQQQPSAAQSTTHMFKYLIVFYTAF